MTRALLAQNSAYHGFSPLGNSLKADFLEKRLPMSNLLAEVGNTLRVHHYAMKTEKSYVLWIRSLVLFHEKESMG